MSVREIRGWTPATALPRAPGFVRGVINLRGVVLPIIDLAERLGFAPAEPTPRHVIIVAQTGRQVVGLLVDAVSDIIAMPADKVQPTPGRRLRSGAAPSCVGVMAIDDRMISLIALDKRHAEPDRRGGMTDALETARPRRRRESAGRRASSRSAATISPASPQMIHADAGINLHGGARRRWSMRGSPSGCALCGMESVPRLLRAGRRAREGADERQEMLAALTTNVTRFFREPHHFEHLKTHVLPPLLEPRGAGGRVRLWSAACSSGQEPYSIALTLLSLLARRGDARRQDARDRHRSAASLDGRARGVYAESLLEGVPRDDAQALLRRRRSTASRPHGAVVDGGCASWSPSGSSI